MIAAAVGPVNRFRPDVALGAALDGLPGGEVEQLYTPDNARRILSAGLRPISYSLRTELAGDAWHWSEEGSWSDPARRQGYWISSDHPRAPVLTGWGYRLPRRGNSVDQAEDDGWSRIDDGDPVSFWKSNPYLGDRPQWVVADLGRHVGVDAARIAWGVPFARRYRVQYWTSPDPYDDFGVWRDFAGGVVRASAGGTALLRLAPHRVRYVRILLETPSRTAPAGARDPRDAAGFAIRELGLGTIAGGDLHDAVVHAADGGDQTAITVSSTDPWHRARDRDAQAEQPGFDRMVASCLTAGRPMLVPAGVLYDTPENAAAMLRFLARRHYPVAGVDLGEEPDGQNGSPEDFATLYARFAAALRAVDRHVRIGGPNLQDAVSDVWLGGGRATGRDQSWTRRFLAARGHAPLDFFSFEHYPYDNLCGNVAARLAGADAVLDAGLARLRTDGVPRGVPWVVTEYGFSAFSGRAEVELPGALFDAGFVAHFLSRGGAAAYLLGYGPDRLFDPDQPCAGYGELMLFGEDPAGRVTWPTPAYHALRLVAQEWVQPGDGLHLVYGAAVRGAAGVAAYPLRRPDGAWSLLLINRDPLHPRRVRIALDRADRPLAGAFDLVVYGARDYAWHAAGAVGHPMRDEPPHRLRVSGGAVTLPPYSLAVLRQNAT